MPKVKCSDHRRSRHHGEDPRRGIEHRRQRKTYSTPIEPANLKSNPSSIFSSYEERRAKLVDCEVPRCETDASADERRVAQILDAFRRFEHKHVFKNLPGENLPGPDTLDMGGQFLTNRARIVQKSFIFERFAKPVPKGALLHLHLNAGLPVVDLLLNARKNKRLYIRSELALLVSEDFDKTELTFDTFERGKLKEKFDIFSPTYMSGEPTWKSSQNAHKGWMKWKLFREKFEEFRQDRLPKDQWKERSCFEDASLGRLDHAERWVRSKMVLSAHEVYDAGQTVNGIWARFNQGTRCFKGLINYESAYRWYIGRLTDQMIEEKVMYAELRPMLLDKSISSDDSNRRIDLYGQMQIISDVVASKQRDLKRDEKRLFPFGLKIIYCTPRSISREKMRVELEECLQLKKQFPDLICGFDLVGAEDRPNHIGYYATELIAFKNNCERENLDIPFLFHAGETLVDTGGSGDPSKSNLIDAVALGAKRIGHGFSLMKHPKLVKKCRRLAARDGRPGQLGICVELNIISNELLHLCGNVKEHRYIELLKAGIPCSINTDNPNFFSNSMSLEFYQFYVGSPQISLHSWKQCGRWSIEYSCLTEEQITEGLQIYEEDWQTFIADILNEFSGLLDEEGTVIDTEVKKAYDRRFPSPSPG